MPEASGAGLGPHLAQGAAALSTHNLAPSAPPPVRSSAIAIFRSQAPVLTRYPAASSKSGTEVQAALTRAAAPAVLERLRKSAPSSAIIQDGKALAKQRHGAPSLQAAPEPELRITSIAKLAQGGRWRTEAMRAYSVPLLLWFTRGQGRITMAGVTRGFGPHTCIYLPPGTMHGFEVSGQVFGSAVFFAPSATATLPDEPAHLRFREAAGQHELTQMIDVLQRELDASRPARARALEHHAGLLSVWLERQVAAQDGSAPLPETGAKRLSAAYAALVEKRFREGLTVADLAAELGVTASHLTRSCNAACGRSAHDILADRIFYEARRQLAEQKTPIHEIAQNLGFTSAAYFTRAFQKATGQTPTNFRSQSTR